MRRNTIATLSGVFLLTLAFSIVAADQPVAYNASLWSGMRYRMIGPERGGRVTTVTGVPSQPYTFYMAQVNGGVFKTTDLGRTWQPIFDDQPTASVGAIAVSVSDPDVIYVGSGEGLHRPDLSIGALTCGSNIKASESMSGSSISTL